MSIKLGSWNMRNFSYKRDMKEIAEIIVQYDIIALQEVRSTDAIILLSNNIHKEYGKKYFYTISDPVGSAKTSAKQTGKRKELYVFMFTDAVQIITQPKLAEADEYFVRSPYIGYFRAGKFDFVLATIHIVWGKKKDRVLEIEAVGKLLNKIIERAGTEHDIILCGDFNTAPEEFKLGSEWRPLINKSTMVKGTSRYDNIWISGASEFENTGICGVGEKCGGSDHFPIYAVFKTDEDDDEDNEIKIEGLSLN